MGTLYTFGHELGWFQGQDMNKKKTAFIAVTALFSLAILLGAVMDITQPEMVVTIMESIGLPLHLLTLIGIWKLLGVGALAFPKFRRVNEWAYAGFFFDLTGAAYVHAAAGDWAGVAPPFVLIGLLLTSYRLRSVLNEVPERTAEPGAAVPAPAN